MDRIFRWFRQASRQNRNADNYPPPPQRPAFGVGEQMALAAAQQWLNEATLAHARAFGLGEERTFSVDQDKPSLKLIHADRLEISLENIQIIGSFRPLDRSFRWSWANENVLATLAETARRARDHASAAGFDSFREPTFETNFEDCRGLAAFAARIGGHEGVYRCITEDHLSVFMAYNKPSLTTDVFPARASASAETAAFAHLNSYDREMLPIDREHERLRIELPDDEQTAMMNRLLAQKLEIYRRYWRRDDAFWEPSSFGWPSEHEPAAADFRLVLPRRAGGVYVITHESAATSSAYVVETFDGSPRITDMDLDWGKYLLLKRKPD